MIEQKNIILLRKIIKQMIKESYVNEDKKPGGGLTKIGALLVVDPSAAKAQIRNALLDTDGEVNPAADKIGVASRTLHGYIADDEDLETVKDRAQDAEKKEKTIKR